ncbi:sce7725 family protein [Enterococcus asini]|uniref:sce7725 family protein n=1 Tax=Enterococcus asini TaxID=57732 RepID=UPI00288C9663|nr:sce7725 family protein [Enterococcus asini]MDT2757867.1 sce7725 family protein [Enterococcus asini]
MYYPYLRGKQFDLLALKELVKEDRLAKTVIPVIEPVKQSKTLLQTLEVFRQKNHPFYLIDNPQAGDFLTETGLALLQDLSQGHRGHIITANPAEFHFHPDDLYFANSAHGVKELPEEYLKGQFAAPFEMRILRQLTKTSGVISLQDPFTRLPRNSYYREYQDEVFTRSHLTYRKQGFSGFGDFSLDSRIYYEQGYPDRDLCLHLVYPGDSRELRVHHFVSPQDPEETPLSQKEKFLQMLVEVDTWTKAGRLPKTSGLNLLLKAHQAGHFPGMGVMRKSVIMHHLEIMGKLLVE